MSPAARFAGATAALLVIAGCDGAAPASSTAASPASITPAVSYGPSLFNGPAPGEDGCNGRQYAGLIGQDQTALERVLIMRPVRVIRPGDAVTEDFSPQRINFVIGADGRIADIGCY
jgi:hypothetical protein